MLKILSKIIKYIFIKVWNLVEATGILIINFLFNIGSLSLFFRNCVKYLFVGRFFVKNFLENVVKLGLNALPIIAFTSFFTGSALGVQLYYGFSNFGEAALEVLPMIVLKTMTKELGPVLCGIIIAARSCTAIASEIANLKKNNQIDVLYSLSINPFNFLIIPRILSVVIFSPILLLTMIVISKYGSYFVLVNFFEFSSYNYIDLTVSSFAFIDLKIGFIKILVFTFFSSFLACFNGVNVQKGEASMGQSVINTVVASCLLILFFNFLITFIFNN